ncbi:MAG: hypothetical protein QX196_15735, partial [Methylococcaceae bacterium]
MSVTISGDTGLAGAATGALNGSLGATTPNTAVVTSINKMAITAPATSVTATTGASYNLTQNSGSSLYVGVDNSAGSAITGTAYAATVWGVGAVPLIFGTNNTEKMRIDASGNVGIGTLPYAWTTSSGYKSLDLPYAAFFGFNGGAGVAENATNTSTGWKYRDSLA